MKTCTNCHYANVRCDAPVFTVVEDDPKGNCSGWIEKPKCKLCDKWSHYYFCPWCGRRSE